VLFGIVFLWQMPHFLAIAWMYRDDYARAGIPLLPVLEPDGRRTGYQALLYAAVLWPVSLLPVITGLASLPYAAVATVLGFLYIGLSVRFAQERSPARRAGCSVFDPLPGAAARRAGRQPRLDVARRACRSPIFPR
jgi:protoheme IX farnesyltransferase